MEDARGFCSQGGGSRSPAPGPFVVVFQVFLIDSVGKNKSGAGDAVSNLESVRDRFVFRSWDHSGERARDPWRFTPSFCPVILHAISLPLANSWSCGPVPIPAPLR